MPNVLFFSALAAETSRLLTQHAPADFMPTIYPFSLAAAEKLALLRTADLLILFPGQIAEEHLRAATRLKLIQLVSVGFDKMDLPLCRALGIPVANNGGANALDVAEHTLAMILAFYRRLVELDANVRANRYLAIESGATTYTIQNKTVGVVGLGRIGVRVARLLRAFGASVLYHDVRTVEPALAAELGVQRVTLPELLQRADVVTLHTPLDAGTRKLIGATELAQMKGNALLVNTCRGPVVDEAALIAALREKRIAGAALDVLEQEPPAADNPLLQMPNVLLTPHTAGITVDTWPRRGDFIFSNLQRVWAGQPPLGTV
jgi:phosphoglycerate dehydrogenase-like enzyme